MGHPCKGLTLSTRCFTRATLNALNILRKSGDASIATLYEVKVHDPLPHGGQSTLGSDAAPELDIEAVVAVAPFRHAGHHHSPSLLLLLQRVDSNRTPRMPMERKTCGRCQNGMPWDRHDPSAFLRPTFFPPVAIITTITGLNRSDPQQVHGVVHQRRGISDDKGPRARGIEQQFGMIHTEDPPVREKDTERHERP